LITFYIIIESTLMRLYHSSVHVWEVWFTRAIR